MLSPRFQNFRQVSEIRRRFGLVKLLQWLALRILKKLLLLEFTEMIWLDVNDLSPSKFDPEFTFRFLTTDEVNPLAADPTYELASEFVSRVMSGRNLCFAALHRGEQVAYYSWYALSSIEGEHHMGVPLSFPAEVAYMYNAFTLPGFRGRRLNTSAAALALQNLATNGITCVFATIECSNFASLRSFRRLGCKSLGRMLTIGRGSSRWNTIPNGALEAGIRFGHQAYAASSAPIQSQ